MSFLLTFFKPLFPSWKFFDESQDTPVLLYKCIDEAQWKIACPVPSKSWSHIFWNPRGNLYLAYHSHMQQLMGDLSSFDDKKLHEFHHHISYKITENFVRALKPERPFHFKVSTIKLTEMGFEIIEDILLSKEIQL